MAAVPLLSRRRACRLSLRSRRRPHARGHRHPHPNGHGPPRRLRARIRLFRLYRGIDRLRGVRLEPLSLVGRGFHDHADLRRFAGVAGSRWFGGLFRTRGYPCLGGWLDFGVGRLVSGGLGGRSAVHSGRDGVSRGHRHPYRDLASAGAARLARWRGRGDSPPGADCPRHRQNQLPDAGDRRILPRVHRPV